jgi:hypothetical protein
VTEQPARFALSRSNGRNDTLHAFVEAVASLRFENCFNPYSDRCATHDHPDAPARRADALSAIMSRADEAPVDAVWIGRDLGHRGGRRTGLALTDDVHVTRHVRRWQVDVYQPTRSAAVAERTAAVVWGILDQLQARIFLWNVFPLHPHEPDAPFTNRQHNAREREAGEEILASLLDQLRPNHVVAIGNNAATSAKRVSSGATVLHVRHPSYGGQADFVRQLSMIYGLPDSAGRLL